MNSRQATTVAQALAAGLWATLSLACLTLLVRRVTGHFQPPLPPLVFATWSLSITAWSSAALVCWRSGDRNRDQIPAVSPVNSGRQLQNWLRFWWPECLSGSLIAFGILITAPPALLAGSGAVAGLLVIGGLALVLILATEQQRQAEPEHSVTMLKSPAETVSILPLESSAAAVTMHGTGNNESSEAEDFDPQTQQTMSRRVVSGTETIEGVCRVQFAETQRDTWLHLSFCPPLTDAPELQLEDLEGAGWELKPAAIYPFGARINIRRSLSAPETGCIAYFAACRTSRAA